MCIRDRVNAYLVNFLVVSMNDTKQLIINCKDMVFDKISLTDEIVNKLFNIDDKFLRDLSNAANEITRVLQGSKIDVEQLANIK